ncbi:MAG: peptidoglycan-associated lipoprotein, partial [Arcticibacterium sp.]
MRKSSLLTLLLSFLAFTASAQLQAYKKGLTSFEKGYYDLAINDLTKVKEIDASQKAKLKYTIAEAYRLSNRWIESIPYYSEALALGVEDDDAVFHYAYGLKANEQYDLARDQFKKYSTLKTDNKAYNELANRELNTLQIVDLLKVKDTGLAFRNLKEVNSEGSEFSPLVYNGQLIFSASRKQKTYSNGLPFLGIYRAKINEDLTAVGDTELFSDAIFDPERNEGTPAFTPNGKTVIFARSNSGK